MPVDAAMTVRLDCNHTQRQVKLHLVKSHSLLVRKYEGTYTVLPWGEGQHPPLLPEGLADTLGPEVWRQLNAKLADAAAPSSLALAASSSAAQQQGRQRKGTAASGGQQQGQHAGRKPRHSLVILHQRLQPGVRPPPGLGGYVRGEACCATGWPVLLSCRMPRGLARRGNVSLPSSLPPSCPLASSFQPLRPPFACPGMPCAALTPTSACCATASTAGQVRRQFERMFGDLHRASSQIAAPRPTMQGEQAGPRQRSQSTWVVWVWLARLRLLRLSPPKSTSSGAW